MTEPVTMANPVTSPRWRVLVVDDHRLIAQGVATALEGEGMRTAVSTGPTADDVFAIGQAFQPHVVLLDLQLGRAIGRGLALIGPLADLGATVVVLTGVSDEAARAECLEMGAHGVARRNEPFDHLVEKVIAAAEGRPVTPAHERYVLLEGLRVQRAQRRTRFEPFERLTAREQEVLDALMTGKQAEAIAGDADVSVATVRSQIRAILRKLGVNSQLGAVAAARHAGWRSPARVAS